MKNNCIDAQHLFAKAAIDDARRTADIRHRARVISSDIEAGISNLSYSHRMYVEGLIDTRELLTVLTDHATGVIRDTAKLDTLTKQL